MKEFTYTITDPIGLHARPAGRLAKIVKAMDSSVTIARADGGRSVSASKLMAIMSLGVKTHETLAVTVEGGNAEENAATLERFFKENL